MEERGASTARQGTVWVVAIALLLGLMALPAVASDGATIAGTVRLLDTEEPVEGFQVDACDAQSDDYVCYSSDPTGPDGRFEIAVNSTGLHWLQAYGTDESSARLVTLQVSAEAGPDVDVWVFEPLDLSGTVVEDSTGEIVQQSNVFFDCTVEGKGFYSFGAWSYGGDTWATDEGYGPPAGCEFSRVEPWVRSEYGVWEELDVVSYTPFSPPASDVEIRVADVPEPEVPPSFADVDADHPFHFQITAMAVHGVIQGYPDGTFRPTVAVTRQAAAAFLYRLAGEPMVTSEAGFDDVPSDHRFHDAIAWMVEQDITRGYPDGTFRPTASVTRQAAAAFLWRFDGEQEALQGAEFSDVPADHPFHGAIAWMADLDISQGWPDGTFRPNEDVTRQSLAAFLSRYWVGE